MNMRREIFLANGVEDSEFERFVYALEFVRRRFPSMTLGAFATFLWIAKRSPNGGIAPTELGERLKQPHPTIFRQCNQLADGLPGKPGMGLVRKVSNANDGRSKNLVLAMAGLELIAGVHDILSTEIPISENEERHLL